MPPGTPHAVYTSEDSLFAGGFCLLPSHLRVSIETACQLLLNSDLTNDDPIQQIPDAWLVGIKDLLRKAQAQGANVDSALAWECEGLALALKEFFEVQDLVVPGKKKHSAAAKQKKHGAAAKQQRNAATLQDAYEDNIQQFRLTISEEDIIALLLGVGETWRKARDEKAERVAVSLFETDDIPDGFSSINK